MPDATAIPVPAATAEPVSGGELATSLLVLPPPHETPTPPAPGAVPAAAPSEKSASLDSIGRPFDPQKFRSNPDGSPYRNGRGHFMPRGGRKPGIPNRATVSAAAAPLKPAVERVSFLPPGPDTPPEPSNRLGEAGSGLPGQISEESAPSRASMEQTAEAYLRMSYASVGGVLDAGTEWQPDDQAEHTGLKEPLTEYLVESGAEPLPPWARLAVAIATFILKRVSRPKTKSALFSFWRKANGQKEPQPVKPTAQPGAARPAAPVNDLEILPFGAR